MAQTATVKRDARMGEAEARMEAGIRVGNNSSKEKNCFYVDRHPKKTKKTPKNQTNDSKPSVICENFISRFTSNELVRNDQCPVLATKPC